MVSNQHSRVIGIFPNGEVAGQAFDQLVFSGFPLEKVFLVGKDLVLNEQSADAEMLCELVKGMHASAIAPSEAPQGIAKTVSGLTKGLIVGNLSGGLIGLLLGVGVLVLPGLGEVALGSAIAFTLLGGSIGTALGGAIGVLMDLGMTEKQARSYSERILRGDYLLIVNGTDDDIQRAELLLKSQQLQK